MKLINYEITYHGIGLSFNKLFHSLLAHLHILHILFIDLFIIYSILNTLWPDITVLWVHFGVTGSVLNLAPPRHWGARVRCK